jgi:pterin-4a-carbinolamine dehydratase
MQTVSCQRIIHGYSRQKAVGRCILSRSVYNTRLQDSYRPALLVCRRLLSSGSSSDQVREDGSGGAAPPQSQQQRPPKRRTDPMAKRPTVKCDPYGQGGKPMSWMEAETLLSTLRLHSDWKLVPTPVQTQSPDLDDSSQRVENESTVDAADTSPQLPPHALEREFIPTDFLSGAKLVQKLAAVAQLDNHFPASLTLSRKIVRKEWQVVTAVQCHTTVLGGLSTNDFHLAMVRTVPTSIDIDTICCERVLYADDEEIGE